MTALTKLRSAMAKAVREAKVEVRKLEAKAAAARSVDGFEAVARAKVALRSVAPAPVIPDAAGVRSTSAALTAARLATARVAVPDPDGLRRFLEGADQVYREELGRPLLGDDTEVSGVGSYGARYVNEGWSLDQVRASVRQSDEWREKHPGEAPGAGPAGGRGRNLVSGEALTQAAQAVKDLYREELLRNPDVSGLSHYSAALLNRRLDVDGLRGVLRASDEYRALHAPPPGPGPVDPTEPNPTPSGPTRTGRVRLEGNSFADDQGKFNALGATYMSALWQYQNDKPRLEQTLAEMKKNGVDYIRVLGTVGDYDNADYWDGREIDWRRPDYADSIKGLTDLAYDKYGLRVEWTLIGDGQKNIPREADRFKLVDTFLDMAKGREQKIMHFEIANEAWQNGFSGDAGVEQLRRLTKYMNDRTDVLVAASAPDGFEPADVEKLYGGGVADLATYHFDRDVSKADGHWRPVRQPWEWQYTGGQNGIPRVATNNEPIGPGASVASENDPKKLVAGAIVSYLSGLPGYVYHTRAGVRGDEDFASQAGFSAFTAMKTYVPADLASWTPKNAHWNDAPFKVYARDDRGNLVADRMWPDLPGGTGAVRSYAAVKGDEFFAFPMGVKDRLTMEPRRAVEFDVINPMTGAVVDHKRVNAGEKFELSGDEIFVLKGRFV